MLSFSAISRVVLRLLFSIIAFILSSSTSVGRPERGAYLRSKSLEQNEQINSGTAVLLMIFHHKHHTIFSELPLRFYFFGSNKVKGISISNQCKKINKQQNLKLFFLLNNVYNISCQIPYTV